MAARRGPVRCGSRGNISPLKPLHELTHNALILIPPMHRPSPCHHRSQAQWPSAMERRGQRKVTSPACRHRSASTGSGHGRRAQLSVSGGLSESLNRGSDTYYAPEMMGGRIGDKIEPGQPMPHHGVKSWPDGAQMGQGAHRCGGSGRRQLVEIRVGFASYMSWLGLLGS